MNQGAKTRAPQVPGPPGPHTCLVERQPAPLSAGKRDPGPAGGRSVPEETGSERRRSKKPQPGSSRPTANRLPATGPRQAGEGREAAGPALPAPSAPSWARPAGPGPAHLSLLEQAPPPPKTAPPARSRRLKRGREGGRKRRERREEGKAGRAGPRPPRLPAAARPRLLAKMAARGGGANPLLASPSGKEPPHFRAAGALRTAQLTSASGFPFSSVMAA